MRHSQVRDQTWIRRFHPRAGSTFSAGQAYGRIHTRMSAHTLVCFPHAGGSASSYFPFAAELGGRLEVLAVQYPGRQDRREEEPIDSIPVLADRVFAALCPWLEDDTVAFFGHSMGAIVAYEVARRAEREAGVSPTALIVSGRRAPTCHRQENVHKQDDDGIIAEVRRLSGTDAKLLAYSEMRRMILPALRGDYRAIETYVYEPGPPLTCPIIAFVGKDDPQASIHEVCAWAEHTKAGFGYRVFGGGHFYLTARPKETIAHIVEVLTIFGHPGRGRLGRGAAERRLARPKVQCPSPPLPSSQSPRPGFPFPCQYDLVSRRSQHPPF
jgi:surfactin synthase thioesterase subunit